MNQDRMRWRDRDMWVDKRKDNSNCIRSPAALGTGNIAFPAEKNNMKTGPQRRGDSLLCLIRSCYSPLTHQDEHAAKQTPTTHLHVQKLPEVKKTKNGN